MKSEGLKSFALLRHSLDENCFVFEAVTAFTQAGLQLHVILHQPLSAGVAVCTTKPSFQCKLYQGASFWSYLSVFGLLELRERSTWVELQRGARVLS